MMTERRSTFSEMLAEIPDNMIFVGCCNPFRIDTSNKKMDEEEEVGIIDHASAKKLSHKVYPICDSLLSYVYDFG